MNSWISPAATLEELRDLCAKRNAPEIEPYAFIRFSNEAITMQASLDSIQPFFKKGIICYHDPLPGITEDGSIAIAQEFCRKNPGFRLVRYPFPVIFQNMAHFSRLFYSGATSRLWLLHAYYTYAHLHLRELAIDNGDIDKAYIYKIDLDHIYSAKLLEYDTLVMRLRALEGYHAAYFYKANVCCDYRDYVIGTKPEPWFTYLANDYDHSICKMTEMQGYLLRVIEHNEVDDEGYNKLEVFELQTFSNDCRVIPDFTFVNSLHFFFEKLFFYTQTKPENVAKIYSKGIAYSRIDWEEMVATLPEAKIDPEFFSYENVQRFLASFKYPATPSEGYKYGRDYIDVDTLYNDDRYRPEVLINDFNQRYAQRHSLEEHEQHLIEIERAILNYLANEDNLVIHTTTL